MIPVKVTSGSTVSEPYIFNARFENVTAPTVDLSTISLLIESRVYELHWKSAAVMVTSVSVLRSTASNSSQDPTSTASDPGNAAIATKEVAKALAKRMVTRMRERGKKEIQI